MRFRSKELFVSCLFVLLGCAADSPDTGADPTSDDGASASRPTAHADAGKPSGKADAAAHDAATHDAATKPPVIDSGSAQASHDAGAASDAPDAAHTGTSGAPDAGMSTASAGETGRLVGMTAAHNAVRAMVMTSPMLPDMVWDPEVAAYAQQWTDSLAASHCDAPMHRSGTDLQKKGYGENLAVYTGVGAPPKSTAKQATDGWAGEVACWTYGTISAPPQFMGTEKCDTTCYMNMFSDGCGHYTQVVWRKSTKLGCGMSTCTSSQGPRDIWICNYSPAGNYAGQTPY